MISNLLLSIKKIIFVNESFLNIKLNYKLSFNTWYIWNFTELKL